MISINWFTINKFV